MQKILSGVTIGIQIIFIIQMIKKWRHLISDKGVTLNTDQFAPDKKPSWEDVKSVITGTGWEIVQEVKH